jgi:hypothetical protein
MSCPRVAYLRLSSTPSHQFSNQSMDYKESRFKLPCNRYHLLTNCLHGAHFFLQKLPVAHLLKNTPMGPKDSSPCSQKPFTAFYPKPDESIPPYSYNIRFNIISHLCLYLPSGLLRSGFPTKALYKFTFGPVCDKRPAHLILLDLIALIIFGQHVTNFLQPLTIPSLFGPKFLISNFVSNSLTLFCFLKVSHPHGSTRKIIISHILMFLLLDSRRRDEMF